MGNLVRPQRLLLWIFLLLFACLSSSKALAITYNNSTSVNIPDNDPEGTSSTIVIPDSMSIADMNVAVNVTHGWIADVVLVLMHEDTGSHITLAHQIGVNEASTNALGCGLNDMDVVFDNEVAEDSVETCQGLSSFAFGVDGSLEYDLENFADEATYLTACVAVEYQCNPSGTAAVQGRILPNDGQESGLNEFYGEDMSGTWTLKISDVVQTDAGELVEWSLTFADTNCGNGTIEGIETCDDGNFIPNDGCSAFCEIASDDDADTYYSDIDCDDTDANIHPDATEVCDDNIDNNCDGNEWSASLWYFDSDDDGFGVTENSVESCEPVELHVPASGDCDDLNNEIYPTQVEIIDDIDNNCNGNVDENTDAFDDDADGYSENDGDCDDSDADINPGIQESCDGIDNNCDEVVDEGCDEETPEEEVVIEEEEEVSEEELPDDDVESDDTTNDDSEDADTDTGPYTRNHETDSSDGTTEAADGEPKSEAERMQIAARNPLKSDVVTAGCSLQLQSFSQNTSSWPVLLVSNLIVLFGLLRIRARRAVPLQ